MDGLKKTSLMEWLAIAVAGAGVVFIFASDAGYFSKLIGVHYDNAVTMAIGGGLFSLGFGWHPRTGKRIRWYFRVLGIGSIGWAAYLLLHPILF